MQLTNDPRSAEDHRLSPIAAQRFLDTLPSKIREALLSYATDTEYSVETVLEMAIAFFLDVDSAGFADCRSDSPGALRERIAILESILDRQGITVPELPE
jgi:hypothetical protein